VQETLVRAWRSFGCFDEGRASLRSWLYAIATNVCLDMLRSTQRRARAMDLGPSSYAGAPPGAPLPETVWVQPLPDRVLAMGSDPAALAVERETIRLAFVAALQHLPPRQRAVLILREVLRWKADEVAQLLDTTVASVNSALQRARSTLEARNLHSRRAVSADERGTTGTSCPLRRRLRTLRRRDADLAAPRGRHDVDAPFAWWLRGRGEINRALLRANGTGHGARLVPTVANGSPAYGQYLPSGPAGGYQPWALVVIGVSAGRIVEMTTFLDAARLFPLFDLPAQLTP
jgi:RNA polymerase sigma-70 factor (ECF subfamily)